MRQILSKNPLFFAWLLPALTDGIVTLAGQDKGYWLNHRLVNEASPAYYFLVASSWLFVLGSVFWFCFWYWLFLRLKEPVNSFGIAVIGGNLRMDEAGAKEVTEQL
ncbi:hypothetical protein COW80_03670, partial [Candidatus Beckwithbacteria bacterium CG22_combo_CG10-13_8_21_14_all_01_47_9]